MAINIDVVPIEIHVHFGKIGMDLCLLFGGELVQFLLERSRKGLLLEPRRKGGLVIRPDGVWIVSFKNIVQL